MTCRIKDFSAIKSFFFSGRYCLQSIPPVIVSRGHELYIHFRARSKAKSNLTRRFKGNFLSHTTGTDMHYQNGDFFFHPTTTTTTITNITATTSIYYQTVFVFLLLHLYFSSACNESIGLQDGRVKNSQLFASSYYTLKLGHGQLYLYPQYGRIEGLYFWCSQVRGHHLHFPNTYGLFRHGKS